MITSYYNTTKETGEELAVSKAKAYTQRIAIMDIFYEREVINSLKSVINMTPSDIWHIYSEEYKNVPLTSIRRAITSLTNDKQLVKTDKMKQGIYGKLDHCCRASLLSLNLVLKSVKMTKAKALSPDEVISA